MPTFFNRHKGVFAALAAAALFGIGTPLAKQMLAQIDPWLLAGLLYMGAGLGLLIYRRLVHAPAVRLLRHECPWFAAALVCGGIIAPVLLMFGLTRMSASSASLLLNAESVFTTLLAWFAFKENLDRRIAAGMLCILAGALLLNWPTHVQPINFFPSLAILAACLAWGLDNNLTRKISLNDASWIAATKGLVAGTVNLILAAVLGAALPPTSNLIGAMMIGFFAYGVSLVLFVVALRHLGTARTGAYFSIAPFIGAIMALLMGDSLSWPLIVAALLMAIGIVLHLTENHQHEHIHEALEHEHEHVHDEHHQHHHHDQPVNEPHRHRHQHVWLKHQHKHFPDMHHPHQH